MKLISLFLNLFYGGILLTFKNITMKTISIQDYANLIGYKGQNLTLEKIQEFAEDELDWTIWDYPLEEYEYALNEVHEGKAEELVIVETDFGIRVCEI